MIGFLDFFFSNINSQHFKRILHMMAWRQTFVIDWGHFNELGFWKFIWWTRINCRFKVVQDTLPFLASLLINSIISKFWSLEELFPSSFINFACLCGVVRWQRGPSLYVSMPRFYNSRGGWHLKFSSTFRQSILCFLVNVSLQLSNVFFFRVLLTVL